MPTAKFKLRTRTRLRLSEKIGRLLVYLGFLVLLLTPPHLSRNVNGHAQLLCVVMHAATVRDCLPIANALHANCKKTSCVHGIVSKGEERKEG